MGLPEVDDLFKQTLAEWIYDEEKLVTYQYLSVSLGVHVNLAKQMLFQFYTEEQGKKSKSKSIQALYYVSGLIKPVNTGDEDTIWTTTICREDNLELVKQSYQSLSSVHVYALEAIDNEDTQGTGYSMKKLAQTLKDVAILREDSEVDILGLGPFNGISPKPKAAKPPPTVTELKANTEVVVKKPTSALTKAAKSKVTVSPFTRAASTATAKSKATKSDSTSSTPQTSEKESDVKEVIPKSEKKTVVKVKEVKSASARKPPPKPKPAATYVDILDSDSDSNHSNANSPAVFPPSPPTPKKKKRKASHSPSPPPRNTQTRRRRIRVLSDSSEDEPEPEASSRKNHFAPTNAEKTVEKKKKTKMVTTQVMDQEGFLVTKREKVTDSESDMEVDPDSEKPEPKPKSKPTQKLSPVLAEPLKKSKVDTSPPPPSSKKSSATSKRTSSKPGASTDKTKQSSITSFFLKKPTQP